MDTPAARATSLMVTRRRLVTRQAPGYVAATSSGRCDRAVGREHTLTGQAGSFTLSAIPLSMTGTVTAPVDPGKGEALDQERGNPVLSVLATDSPGAAAAAPPLLEARGISKRFGGIQALDGVDFTLRAGEVMALAGENGAGKSTLIKILAGAYQRDAGEIRIDGKPTEIHSPGESERLGISVIYQEFNLTPNQTVAENVFLREPPRRGGFLGRLNLVDQGARRKATQVLLEQVGSSIDPDLKVSELTVAHQQMTEIAKALAMDARILIMDEPTSTLPDAEVDILFGIIGQLRAKGIAVVFVSHRLEETRRIADRVTVLRDGQFVGEEVGRGRQRPADHPDDGRARPWTRSTPRPRPPRPTSSCPCAV